MKITADYPLYNNLIGNLDGVEFIKEYLSSIYLENLFCKKFSEEKIPMTIAIIVAIAICGIAFYGISSSSLLY